jgi:hypothetical protein
MMFWDPIKSFEMKELGRKRMKKNDERKETSQRLSHLDGAISWRF